MVSPAVIGGMGAAGIALGAFGAHGLKGKVDPAMSMNSSNLENPRPQGSHVSFIK